MNKSSETKALPGYPLMEDLIQTENFEEIRVSMGQAYKLLEEMQENNTGGLNKQKQIKKVITAYDLTFDMIRHLLQTKQEMIEKVQESEKK